jgi:acyl carrier protein
MIPAAWQVLDRLPLTPSGKLDHRALPAPAPAAGPAQYAAPQTPLQEALADIWAEVLGAGRVGIHDNFFDLGGDSLRSVGIAARVQSAFEIAITPRDVLVTQTIADLADLVEEMVLQEFENAALGDGDER